MLHIPARGSTVVLLHSLTSAEQLAQLPGSIHRAQAGATLPIFEIMSYICRPSALLYVANKSQFQRHCRAFSRV
jgi:hypothetical protein